MGLDQVRRAVLVDMAYEIGGEGLAQFERLLDAVRGAHWGIAAAELKNSRLYSQVPVREQANMMALATGLWPSGVADARDLIRRHEGCVLVAQPDAKGKWEIGYGHDITAPPDGSRPLLCTQPAAELWFEQDFLVAEARAELDLGQEWW